MASKTITILDIAFDVEYNATKVNNDNGVGQDSTYITIGNICLHGDTGYDLEEVLSQYVLDRINETIERYL